MWCNLCQNNWSMTYPLMRRQNFSHCTCVCHLKYCNTTCRAWLQYAMAPRYISGFLKWVEICFFCLCIYLNLKKSSNIVISLVTSKSENGENCIDCGHFMGRHLTTKFNQLGLYSFCYVTNLLKILINVWRTDWSITTFVNLAPYTTWVFQDDSQSKIRMLIMIISTSFLMKYIYFLKVEASKFVRGSMFLFIARNWAIATIGFSPNHHTITHINGITVSSTLTSLLGFTFMSNHIIMLHSNGFRFVNCTQTANKFKFWTYNLFIHFLWLEKLINLQVSCYIYSI